VVHLPGRLLGDFPPQQPADNVQAHVDSGGDPCRADDTSIVHEAAVGINRRIWGNLSQKVNGPVVRGACPKFP
jgi:hypothetical protein